MDKVRVLTVKQSVFANNIARANELRAELKKKNVYLVNLMSSPGSGKTTFLVSFDQSDQSQLRVGVMEADIDATVDAETIEEKTGVKAIQLHTAGECHLDAKMTQEGIEGFGVDDLDLVFLENVGNLVCPAEFDTGAALSIEILSIPEGDDKPLKYPLMFKVANVVVFSKIDTISVFDFDIAKAEDHIRKLNPNSKFFPLSAKTGEGMEALADYLVKEVKAYQASNK
jgi:hydrogenase nickel incorporation protein HypB